jgi:hypothetical protein
MYVCIMHDDHNDDDGEIQIYCNGILHVLLGLEHN